MWASPGRRSELAHVCKSCVLCLDSKVERELILQTSLERRIPSGCRETFNSGIIVTRDLWHSSCYNDDEREPNPSSNRICREPIWAPPPMSAHVCAMSLNAAHAQLSQYASTFFIVSRTHHRKRRESIPITRRLTINSATLWIPYSPPKNSQKKAIQHSLSLTRLFSLSKAFLRLSTPRGRWYQRRDDGIEVCFILLYLFIYLFSLLDWKAVSRLCGRTASWQDLSHFTLHLPPALSLPHAERHSGRRSPSPSPRWSKRNKIRKAMEKDGRINMLIYMNYLFSPLWFTCCCFLPSIVHLLVFSIILPTFVSLTHSPTLSPLLMSRISIPPPPPSPPSPPLPDAYDSRSKCLYLLLFPRFPPTLTLLPHPHGFLRLSLTFLCSPLIASSSSPTVFPPSPCASQITVLAADTFIAVRPIEPEEGATPTRVTLSLPLHPAARNPPIFSSAAAFWDPSFPPSLSSKSPRPLCVALSFVPRSSVTKLLKPPLMTSPIQEFQVPFSDHVTHWNERFWAVLCSALIFQHF